MKKQTVSFGVGGLLLHETLAIIDYLVEGKIKELNEVIKTAEVLKTNSESSRVRFVTELRRRYKVVNNEIWQFIKDCPADEQKLALFFVCLKASQLLFDFQFEIVLEKWRTLDLSLDKNDVLYFFNKKSLTYPEIEKWSEKTKAKSAIVFIRILNETGFLVQNKITRPDVSKQFWQFFIGLSEAWFLEWCLLSKVQRDQIMEEVK